MVQLASFTAKQTAPVESTWAELREAQTRTLRSQNTDKSVAELINESFSDKVFKTVIRDNVALAEAPIKGLNIFEYNKNCREAKGAPPMHIPRHKTDQPD